MSQVSLKLSPFLITICFLFYFQSFISVGDGKESKASALLFQFDGEEWEEIQKVKYDWLRDPYNGFSAVAVDLATYGFDEFCH